MTETKEKTTSPKGKWFWVEGKTDGKFRIQVGDGKTSVLTQAEYDKFKSENTELPTNQFQAKFPPPQAFGSKSSTGGGVSSDIVNAAFEFIKLKCDALATTCELLEGRVAELEEALAKAKK